MYQMQFSNDNSNWSLPETYATLKLWPLSTGDGTTNKTVLVRFMDRLGTGAAPVTRHRRGSTRRFLRRVPSWYQR